MRPLKIKISGLRSYRTEQEIDFTDVGLMAIIGDTGAGKSSLLEAICAALYGTCTWSGSAVKPLIADGADTMQVELTFRAKDKTWQVYRGISRGQYPTPRHHLKCLDDRTDIDGADAVTAKIRDLVGLDYDTFLKTVLLPQGRFQVLLQMRPRDRTSVLKSILGLDQLSDIRDEAQALVHVLRPKLDELVKLRGRLLSDPDTVATDARCRLDRASARRTEFDDSKNQIAASRVRQTAATERIKVVRSAAQRLAEAAVDDAEATYRRLAELKAQLDDELTAKRSQIEALECQEHDLDAAFSTADEQGVGVSGLATAANTITTLVNDVPELEAERERCVGVSADIQNARDELARQETALAEKQQAAAQAEAAAGDARALADSAADGYATAKARLAEARAASKAADDSAAAVVSAQEELRERKEALDQAVREAEEAEAAKTAAAEKLDALRRADFAAHAASASHPGDPCPICGRVLPDDFETPPAPGTTDAQAASKKADEIASRLVKRASATEANRDNARIVLEKATTDAQGAERTRDAAIAEAKTLLPNVDLALDDTQLLSPAQDERDQTARARDDADRAARTARNVATAAEAELKPTRKNLAGREKELIKAERTLQGRIAGLAKRLDSIPEPYRAPQPPTVDALTERLALVRHRQQALESDTRRLRGLRQELTSLRRESEVLLDRQRTEIEIPRADTRSRVELLAERVRTAAGHLGQPEPPRRTVETLTDDGAWAAAVVATARDLAEKCGEEVNRLEREVGQAQTAAEAVWTRLGFAGDEALDEALRVADEDAGAARKDLATAERHKPLAADLDQRLGKVEPFVAALDDLIRLLADGKFLGVLVQRKQRALLGIASEILLSMTRDRFGFAEAFQIVDNLTGQPRDVKTLSGGETFLASLALALALVELAGRGGGRLEALFLDEGFRIAGRQRRQ